MKQLSMYDQMYGKDFNLAYQDKDFQSTCSKDLQATDSRVVSNNCRYLKIHPEKPVENTNSNLSGYAQSTPEFAPNVTEIVLTRDKVESIPLILPMLINLHQEERWLAWIDPPIQVLKEWQRAHNEKALNQIMILRSNESFSVFELSKRALEAGTCHAVIAWTNSLNQEEFSRLEQASSNGNSHGIILRLRTI